MPDRRPIALRVLSHVPFPLVVIAAFLAWEGYKRYELLARMVDWETILFLIAAILSLVLAFTVFRARSRPHDD